MKQFILKNKKFLSITLICLALGIFTMSFRDLPFGPLQHYDSLTAVPDSVPADKPNEKKMTMKEYDEMMEHLTKSMKELTTELSKLNTEKINAALKKIDWNEITASVDKALKEVDFASIEANIKNAMKDIDWDKMNSEIKASLENAKDAMEKIDMKEIKEELEQAKKEIEKSKAELQKIDIQKISENAKEEMKNAAELLRRKKEMFIEMEKDGLISQEKGFKIEYKKGNLYINDKKQSEEVQNKYRKYFDGDENFEISL